MIGFLFILPVSYFQVPRVKLASLLGVLFQIDFSDVSFPPLMPLKRKGIIRLTKFSFRLGLGMSFYSSTTNLFICTFGFFFNKTKLVENKEFQTPIHIYYYYYYFGDWKIEQYIWIFNVTFCISVNYHWRFLVFNFNNLVIKRCVLNFERFH